MNNKKVFGLAVDASSGSNVGDTVMAYNRHGASQMKVLGTVVTDSTGKAMTRTTTTSVNGVPTLITQALFTVAL
jgi:hypothetical protein